MNEDLCKLIEKAEKTEKEKYRDIKTGDMYTISLDNGTKLVYLVLDSYDSEYVDEFDDTIRVKYLRFFVDKNGVPEYCEKRDGKRWQFVENVLYADVKHGCFKPYEYEDAVYKLQLDFYRKVNN